MRKKDTQKKGEHACHDRALRNYGRIMARPGPKQLKKRAFRVPIRRPRRSEWSRVVPKHIPAADIMMTSLNDTGTLKREKVLKCFVGSFRDIRGYSEVPIGTFPEL